MDEWLEVASAALPVAAVGLLLSLRFARHCDRRIPLVVGRVRRRTTPALGDGCGATEDWGVVVTRVEVKEIPPRQKPGPRAGLAPHLGEGARQALCGLGDAERQAIVLTYFGGYTYRQVADLLQQPEQTVRSSIATGLAQLRVRPDDTTMQSSEKKVRTARRRQALSN